MHMGPPVGQVQGVHRHPVGERNQPVPGRDRRAAQELQLLCQVQQRQLHRGAARCPSRWVIIVYCPSILLSHGLESTLASVFFAYSPMQ